MVTEQATHAPERIAAELRGSTDMQHDHFRPHDGEHCTSHETARLLADLLLDPGTKNQQFLTQLLSDDNMRKIVIEHLTLDIYRQTRQTLDQVRQALDAYHQARHTT